MLYAIALDSEEMIVNFESGKASEGLATDPAAEPCPIFDATIFNRVSRASRDREAFDAFDLQIFIPKEGSLRLLHLYCD